MTGTRQEINLLPRAPRQPPDPLSPRGIAVTLGALVAALALVTAVVGYQHNRAGELLAEAQAEREAAAEALAGLEEAMAERQPPEALSRRIAELERELEAREALLERLEVLEGARLEGFSPDLRGLAEGRVEGAWLRRIELTADGEVRLIGSAEDPARVRALLDALRATERFAERRFRVLDVSGRDAAGTERMRVDFELATGGRP